MTVEGGEKLCDESDVVMHYRIIVGRDPESAAVIEAAKRQPLTRFVRSGFLSGEFQDNVIFKLANGRPLPHERISARPTLDQISWLIQHLELGPDTLKNLDSVGSWTDLFRFLFTDVNFRRLVPALRDTDLLQELPRGLLRQRISAVEESERLEQEVPQRHRRDRDVSGDMVIVTGMHRSGTSLCASLISLLGVDISDEIEPTADNPSGHWERPELVQLHDRVLRTLGRSWHDPGHALALPPEWLSQQEVQALKDDIEGWLEAKLDTSARPLGFKDPRVARLVALWDQICAELGLNPRYVFCVRHPAQVIRSMTRRDAISAQEAAYRWMVYNSDAIRSLGDRKVCIVPYEEWFGDRNGLLRRLASFIGADGATVSSNLEDVVAGIIDRGLRHDAPPAAADTIVTALHRHLLDCAQADRFSSATREMANTFAAVHDFLQPMLNSAYAQRAPVDNTPTLASGGVSYDMDAARLAGRIAANIKLHTEALSTLLDNLRLQSRPSPIEDPVARRRSALESESLPLRSGFGDCGVESGG